jgi:glycosyltransferase involved in cell wall biosynthesis
MNINNTPKISVLMPAYNAESFIKESISSIINQTFTDFEFIIIDDCSTDNTWKIILELQGKDKRIVAVKNQNNLKLSLTLNKGIELCKAKYIARMDADDYSLPDRLEKQYNYMEANPDIGISGGTMRVCDGNLKAKYLRFYHQTDSDIRKHIFRYSPYCHPLVIFKKEVFSKVGLYDTNYNPAEDYELYFRIGKYFKFGNLTNTLLNYRVIEKSMTTGSTKKMELQTINIREKYAKGHGYKMSLLDKIYNFSHFLSIYIIPRKIKLLLFNLTRDKKIKNI